MTARGYGSKTSSRRRSELEGPLREVVYIFERAGERGGGYWWLVLGCGHAVARKRYVASPKKVNLMFQRLSDKLAPKRVQCIHCSLGSAPQDPWIRIEALGGPKLP
jgi:hypothetical protein